MFSLRHIAARKIPENICTSIPFKTACETLYIEANRELYTLRNKTEAELVKFDAVYTAYNDTLYARGDNGAVLEELAVTYLATALGIQDTYNGLEESDSVEYDLDPWYSYIEYIVCALLFPGGVSDQFRKCYMHMKGVHAILSSIPVPDVEPMYELTPIISAINRLSTCINKYIDTYDSEFSYAICVEKQKEYANKVVEHRKISKELKGKIEFYEDVANRMRPVFKYIPSVCKKI